MSLRSGGRAPAAALSLGALGVVFGDIGTSPLYAFRESLGGEHDLVVSEAKTSVVLCFGPEGVWW